MQRSIIGLFLQKLYYSYCSAAKPAFFLTLETLAFQCKMKPREKRVIGDLIIRLGFMPQGHTSKVTFIDSVSTPIEDNIIFLRALGGCFRGRLYFAFQKRGLVVKSARRMSSCIRAIDC